MIIVIVIAIIWHRYGCDCSGDWYFVGTIAVINIRVRHDSICFSVGGSKSSYLYYELLFAFDLWETCVRFVILRLLHRRDADAEPAVLVVTS